MDSDSRINPTRCRVEGSVFSLCPILTCEIPTALWSSKYKGDSLPSRKLIKKWSGSLPHNCPFALLIFRGMLGNCHLVLLIFQTCTQIVWLSITIISKHKDYLYHFFCRQARKKITPGNKFHLAIFCSKGTMSQVWELVLGTPLRNSNSLLNIGWFFRSPLFAYAEISLLSLLRNACDVSYFILTQQDVFVKRHIYVDALKEWRLGGRRSVNQPCAWRRAAEGGSLSWRAHLSLLP